jgi:hypothetical protein
VARRRGRLCRANIRRFGLKLIIPEHFPDVGAGFTNPRYLTRFHAMHPCIIGSQRERKFAVIEVQKATEVFGTASNVLNGIVDVGHAQCGGRIRRQLHEPHRTLSRHDVLAKVRFCFDDGAQQRRIEAVPFCVDCNRASDFLLRIMETTPEVGFGRCRSHGDHEGGRRDDAAAAKESSDAVVVGPGHPCCYLNIHATEDIIQVSEDAREN